MPIARTGDLNVFGGNGRGAGPAPVVVAGAGAAGMAAALSAARCGASVYLIEAAARPGGTVADVLIHTLAGLYDSSGQLLQDGLGGELIERLRSGDATVRRRRMGRLWVLSACPDRYRQVVEEWLASEGKIKVFPHSRVSAIACEAGRITRLKIVGPHGRLALQPGAVVEATGIAEVVRAIDPGLIQDEASCSAGGMIFRMRGVVPGSLGFPGGARLVQALRAAVAEGKLPPTCAHTWIDTGFYEDEAFVKLFVPLPADWRNCRGEITREAKRVRRAVVAFLTKLPAFAYASVTQCGSLGVRDGGRVQGEYCLTADDVRQMRKFADAACRGCWPIEYWDPIRGVSLEHLPPDDYYEIPFRALKVKGLENLWTAGKCLSADAYAQASARVVGTCWAMGEAVGRAAAGARTQAERANCQVRTKNEHQPLPSVPPNGL